jgi:hypothetical protein
MTTATAERESLTAIERESLTEIIRNLPDSAIEKLVSYAAFLRHEERMEELEDEEDIAYLKTLTPEDYKNAVPFEEVIRDFEAKHGPLYQD